MESWSFLANHARVLLCLAHDPGTRPRDIGASLDITDRSAYGIITDLTAAGYVVKHKDGRRNRYQIQARLPLPEPASQEPAIGEVLALLVGERLGRVPDGAERTRQLDHVSVNLAPQPQPRITAATPLRPGHLREADVIQARQPPHPQCADDAPACRCGTAARLVRGSPGRRTLTFYTDLRRVTAPLGISDRNTIWLFLVDRAGQVRWRGSGSWDPATAASLAAALAGLPKHASAAEPAAGPGAGQFEMAFDPRFRLPLATLGVTPATAHVTVTADRLVACFGPWTCRTTPANVRAVNVTGPYRWYRAIGPRLSLADHGLTFGTTPARGVCLLLREPVPGINPLGVIRHPGLTLTVADPERFAATVRHYAGLPAPRDAAPS